jgi:hypothetical protein
MIGISKMSPGRMGNRLFHYNFLRQISKKTGIDSFCVPFSESELFENITVEKRRTKFFKTTKYTSKEILNLSPDDFLHIITEGDARGRDFLLNPPMLGEVFFDYLFYDPNEFFQIKKQYRKDVDESIKDKKVIALHFRGTDFEAWNKSASLKFDYYKKAIDFCIESFSSDDIIFGLFTDDINFLAYTETLSYIKKTNKVFFIGNLDKPPIVDFYQITQSDVLISSPSTFAIFAGLLGKKKKIIHDKTWIDYALDKKDTFWVKLSTTQNSYYSLWKTI